MKKKAYKQPQFNVIEVKAADIIATSTQADVTINGETGILIDQENW